MTRYIATRILLMLVTILLVITITFVLMHTIPGGPFTQAKKLPPAVLEAVNEKYHLNDPLHKQYFDYLKGVITFDLGPSFKSQGQTVNDFIINGMPISARIGLMSASFALVVGISSGILAALYQSKTLDYMLLIFATLGVCIPGFVIATGLIYVFALKLQWLPVFGLSSWKGLILPVLALSGYTTAFIMRLVRSSMIEVMEQDYINTARAYGFSEPVVIIKHGLRNAILPVVSYVGPMVSVILTGSFVVEKIFALPGMGRYFVESISNRDYTTIMGFTIFDTVLLVIGVLAADIIYGLVDPRIKVHE